MFHETAVGETNAAVLRKNQDCSNSPWEKKWASKPKLLNDLPGNAPERKR